MRHKILTDVEFPAELDMEKYLVKGSPKQCTEFELYGIVVHYGSLTSGHYRAFIKSKAKEEAKEARWMCYDDNYVREVEEARIFQ